MSSNTVPLEDAECKVFHEWLDAMRIPHTHIANESNFGSQYAKIRGARNKRLGVSRGVWDYEVYLPIKGVTGDIDAYELVKIEMKRQKASKVSPEQKRWGEIYEKAGIICKICYGASDAIDFIKKSLYN